MSTLYLLDASVYIFRAYYALPEDITDRDGRSIGAVYGFLDFLLKILSQMKSRHIMVAFDGSLRTSFRNRIYPAYKANRESPPEDLLHQFALCRAFIDALGIFNYIHDEYEADDLIGTAAGKMRRRGFKMVFISEDKDLVQLMRPHDIFWRAARQEKMNYKAAQRKYLVAPERFADLLALCGDAIDNIPGIKGLGPKTAAMLLNEFGTLHDLINNVDQLRERNGHRQQIVYRALKENAAQVRIAYQLTRIAEDAPMRCGPNLIRRRRPDTHAVSALVAQCDFSPALARRLLSI